MISVRTLVMPYLRALTGAAPLKLQRMEAGGSRDGEHLRALTGAAPQSSSEGGVGSVFMAALGASQKPIGYRTDEGVLT